MKINLKVKHLKNAVYALLLLGVAYFSQPVFQHFAQEVNPQTAAWFGTGSEEFEPYAEKSQEQNIRTWIHFALIFAGGLIILVLAYVFDIASYAHKLTGKKIASANHINAYLLFAFLIIGLGFVVWEFIEHGKHTKVYNSSSEHGVDYDNMFMITLVLTGIVFVITQFALFGYSFKYRKTEKSKALYYSHNNKLEIFWTIIPAIVLTVLVLKGYSAWSYMMYDSDDKENANKIEVYAFQFGWSARYPGPDGEFGAHSFNFISDFNDMGLAVPSEVEKVKVELMKDTSKINKQIAGLDDMIVLLEGQAAAQKRKGEFKAVLETEKEIASIKSGDFEAELRSSFKRKTKQLQRLAEIENDPVQKKAMFTGAVHDDVITKQIVLLKNQRITLKFRARDVIHSAFLPDFRVQMNCVPGMSTQFSFIPTKSTADIRKEKKDDEFDYYMYCNKICGQAHFNMKIKVLVVDTQDEFNEWMYKQKPAFPMELPGKKRDTMEMDSTVQSDSVTIEPSDTITSDTIK